MSAAVPARFRSRSGQIKKRRDRLGVRVVRAADRVFGSISTRISSTLGSLLVGRGELIARRWTNCCFLSSRKSLQTAM